MNRTIALALAFVVGAYALVGTIDYRVATAIAAERKAVQTSRQDPARLWSKKCERQQLDAVISQADGGKRVIHCVARRVLTVATQ